ncbi:MAG: glycerol-3-phosphate acyltransferase, partial [Chloroflexota bacterium]
MVAVVALLVGCYLLGAFPQVYLLGRLWGVDLRREADLHIALWRQVSPVPGFIGIVGDMAKGVIPILVIRGLGMDPWVAALAGLLAVAGQ